MSNEATAKEAPKKSKTTLLLIVVAVLALVGTGVSLYTLLSSNGNAASGPPAATVQGPYQIFGPQDFTVNLADEGQRRYLKATIALGYVDKGLAKELEQRKEQIRSLVIEVLRSRSAADLADSDGTQTLRIQLIEEINAALSKGKIEEIYFTDLLVQ